MLFLSWHRTLRLWDLESRKITVTFVDFVNDVLSFSFFADNKQIASGSMDKTIKNLEYCRTMQIYIFNSNIY